MRFVILLGFLAVAAHAKTVSLYNTQDIINTVNSAKTTWKAGHNFDKDISLKYVKSLLGVKHSTTNKKLPLKSHKDIDIEIPEEFDARKQWPNCPINHIVDQGTCGSCWAVAAASAFSDRACIASGGQFTLPLSAEELLTCCDDCGAGCDGGYPSSAWSFFEYNGISTGGDFGSNVGCQPYQIQPCEHHTSGKLPSCSDLPMSETPECKSTCINANYSSSSFKSDHHKVKNAYSISSEVEEIQKEIMTNGPVEVSFTVYADFPNYKEGVYQYTTGGWLGGHAVRMIGWGTENGTPYWLIANSWNTDWGDKGLFKIIRGQDECGIEDDVNGGIPIVN